MAYKARLDESRRRYLEGDSDAVSGLLTVADNMLREPLNPEIAGLLKKYPGACATERTPCIYREADREYLSRLKGSAEAVYDHPHTRHARKEDRDAAVKDVVKIVKKFRDMFPGLSQNDP
ncbi:MAG: hypothetical protein HYU56_02470 [Candidatus Aenigmarchaeota archaeon]|nr:hypothetical protein [Candidatus Aenigmarchaeota archaeon]